MTLLKKNGQMETGYVYFYICIERFFFFFSVFLNRRFMELKIDISVLKFG